MDASHIDMDTDPLSFLAILDHFVSVQNFEELTPDQWIWLHVALAAYVSQVILSEYESRWDLINDERGPNYVLIAKGRDGNDHAISPMDIVYNDFKISTPPEVGRMIAAAEVAAGVALESWGDRG